MDLKDFKGHILRVPDNTDDVFVWCPKCQGKYIITEIKIGDPMTWKKQENTVFTFSEDNKELIGTIEAIGAGGYENKKYTIKQEDNSVVVVFGTKVLDARMSDVKIGDKIKIVYTGTEPPKVKGYKPTVLFDVFIDK